jgi:hypothetical protein
VLVILEKNRSQQANRYEKLLRTCIRETVSEFEKNPFNFLSEDDVKCHLFMKLWTKGNFHEFQRTEDGQEISALHSEITYFDDWHQLNVHADISIINPEQTDVYSRGRRHPRSGAELSKQYQFRDSFAIVEIKYNRGTWSKGKTRKKWEEDLMKLQNLLNRIPDMHYFSILLDKKGHFSSDELDQIQQEYPLISVIYGKRAHNVHRSLK